IEVSVTSEDGCLDRLDAQRRRERGRRARGEAQRLVEGGASVRLQRWKAEERADAIEGLAIGRVPLAMSAEEREQLVGRHAALPRESAAAVASSSAWVFAASDCRRCACDSVTAR